MIKYSQNILLKFLNLQFNSQFSKTLSLSTTSYLSSVSQSVSLQFDFICTNPLLNLFLLILIYNMDLTTRYMNKELYFYMESVKLCFHWYIYTWYVVHTVQYKVIKVASLLMYDEIPFLWNFLMFNRIHIDICMF